MCRLCSMHDASMHDGVPPCLAVRPKKAAAGYLDHRGPHCSARGGARSDGDGLLSIQPAQLVSDWKCEGRGGGAGCRTITICTAICAPECSQTLLS
eukprot:COSAG03_NODE_18893_length_346_cov_0.809717_1_plen_95_part_01